MRTARKQLGLFDGFTTDYVDPPQKAGWQQLECEGHLVTLALELAAPSVAGWSEAENRLCKHALPVPSASVDAVCRLIKAGHDPLGTLFCRIRAPEIRRAKGAVYTPTAIVDAMLNWAALHASPARVVDPGAGSGRYLTNAAPRFPNASLVGIEVDPLAAMMARANLSVCGYAERAEIVLGDYRSVALPPIDGRTLYVGNPPYIRHHLLEPRWKEWLIREASARGLSASQLAGLHVHFILATAIKATPRDFGAFITSSEWLDVNYGSLVRELFLGTLGGRRLVVVEPTAEPFPDTATTAAIAYFEVGSRPKTIRLKRAKNVAELSDQNGNRLVRRERLEAEKRWSHLTRVTSDIPSGYIELGELCRVHRGQVTGSNDVWIAGLHGAELPKCVLLPTVTKARELIRAGKVLLDASTLRRVIDLPVDLERFDADERRAIDRFLRFARQRGAHESYTATNRKAWWAVGLREPAPILATYMARRPPAFVRNRADARHLNIAHGLYPRERMSDAMLNSLVDYLGGTVSVRHGRTYAGGLTKFEPREMERLPIPEPKLLLEMMGAR